MAKARYYPERGDIIFTDFDPAVGHEQRLARPALVLSPKAFNQKLELALVAPITSTIRGHGFEVVFKGEKAQGAILCHQVKVIDYKERGAKFIEKIDRKSLATVLAKVRILIDDSQEIR